MIFVGYVLFAIHRDYIHLGDLNVTEV